MITCDRVPPKRCRSSPGNINVSPTTARNIYLKCGFVFECCCKYCCSYIPGTRITPALPCLFLLPLSRHIDNKPMMQVSTAV